MASDLLALLDTTFAMQAIVLLLCVLLVSIYHLDAFVSPNRVKLIADKVINPNQRLNLPLDGRRPCNTQLDAASYKDAPTSSKKALTHADILWKIRPPPETSRVRKMITRIAANLIRLDCLVRRVDQPILLCPKGGQAVLEAHYRSPNNSSKKSSKIGRFGITTESGPPVAQIQETVCDLYGLDPNILVRTAAIIYMFVEPEYRGNDTGKLALQVMSLIHAVQGCDFTVLVADDSGSGKLVDWYEQQGYSKAPKLQETFGSPDGKYGITMIAPTQRIRVCAGKQQQQPTDCLIQWW
jgi:hypothetical protein